MGKKYRRYVAMGSGVSPDPNWAFEVQGSKVVTYKAEKSGFLGLKTTFVATSETPLTPELEVRVWDEDAKTGSGTCNLESKGQTVDQYCVFGEVEEFATTIRAALR